MISLIVVAMVIATAFFVGGYVSTGSWSPWGHRRYYQNLDANFGYCVTGSENYCESVHNVMFNSGVAWVDQAIQGTTGTVTNGCFPSATCGMSFIALSNSAVTFAAADTTYGATNGNCAVFEGGTEIAASGLARAAATTNTLLSGASGSTSQLIKTFTATATQGVQASCLVSTGTAGAAGNIQLAAASFAAVTLQNGDTIQITWTLTWTWT